MKDFVVSVDTALPAMPVNSNVCALTLQMIMMLDLAQKQIEAETYAPQEVKAISRGLSNALFFVIEAGALEAAIPLTKIETVYRLIDEGRQQSPADIVRLHWLVWIETSRSLILKNSALIAAMQNTPDDFLEADHDEALPVQALGHDGRDQAGRLVGPGDVDCDDRQGARPEGGRRPLETHTAAEVTRWSGVKVSDLSAAPRHPLARFWRLLRHPFERRSNPLPARLLAVGLAPANTLKNLDR